MQRGKHAQAAAIRTAAGTARAQRVTMKPVPKATIEAVNDTLTEAGAAPTPEMPGTDGGEMSFLKARMANEVRNGPVGTACPHLLS